MTVNSLNFSIHRRGTVNGLMSTAVAGGAIVWSLYYASGVTVPTLFLTLAVTSAVLIVAVLLFVGVVWACFPLIAFHLLLSSSSSSL